MENGSSPTQKSIVIQENIEYALHDILHQEAGIKGSYNLQFFTLYSSENNLLLQRKNSFGCLIIDRKTGRIKEGAEEDINLNDYKSKRSYSCFLGILNVYDKSFLVFVNEALPICTIQKHEIYTIRSISFVPIELESELGNTNTGKQALPMLKNIRTTLCLGYYFSLGYNLTLCRSKKPEENSTADNRFLWNKYMHSEFEKFEISNTWKVNLIQGFIGSFSVMIQGKSIDYVLIFRRAIDRGGIRYQVKGLDDHGNVANFVESEQIIFYKGIISSYVQVRGTPPVFFSQKGPNSSTKLHRTFDLTNYAYMQHIDSLLENYGYVMSINLMCKGRKYEQFITEAYETHIKNNNLPTVKYQFFDYVQATKDKKLDRVNEFIQQNIELVKSIKFHAEDQNKNKLMDQEGVFRTNDIDCVERTNLIQTKFAMCQLEFYMKQLGIDLLSVFGKDPVQSLDSENAKQFHPFVQKFKDLWDLGGDMINLHYGHSRSYGKFTLQIDDQARQNVSQILQNEHPLSYNVYTLPLERAVQAKIEEYSKKEEVSLFCTVWNMGGWVPHLNLDLGDLFQFEGNTDPDIIVFGLQEYIDLNTKNILSGDDVKALTWKELIAINLRKKNTLYSFVVMQQLVGILLIIFAKTSIVSRISDIDVDVVKTGLAGTVGNKGAALARFKVDETSLVFTNVHMEAGGKANKERLMNVLDIHSRAFPPQSGMKKRERILDHDYRFFMGDTNFRINYGNLETRHLVEQCIELRSEGRNDEADNAISSLFSYDQLFQSRNQSEILNKYKEAEIKFLPTYKYDMNSTQYDTSKKQRTPSWTDRILYSFDKGNISQKFYTRREYLESDHRPVVAYFKLETVRVDEEKKAQLTRKIYQDPTNFQDAIQKGEVIENQTTTQDLINKEFLKIKTIDENMAKNEDDD